MTEHQYRVIADRDKGDDPQWLDVQRGDRYTAISDHTGIADEDDPLVRVERPVTTTTVTPPDSPEANARARAEGQTITFEPPVQPPTREQIAEALATWWEGTDPDGVMAEDIEALKADLVALFPQPTPSAEPAHPRAQPIDVVARSIVHALLTEADSDDIALWEDYPEIGENDWDEVIAAARSLAPAPPSDEEYRVAYAALDPTTLRDVAPPPVTPEVPRG